MIDVQGLAGNDSLTVDSTNGAISIPINFDGGDDADSLTLTGGTATSDTYSPGPNPGQGTSAIVIGGVTQTVSFTNLEPVLDLVGGPLVVNATDAGNAIDYRQGSVAANGLVSIDSQETIEFSNKTTLTINHGQWRRPDRQRHADRQRHGGRGFDRLQSNRDRYWHSHRERPAGRQFRHHRSG